MIKKIAILLVCVIGLSNVLLSQNRYISIMKDSILTYERLSGVINMREEKICDLKVIPFKVFSLNKEAKKYTSEVDFRRFLVIDDDRFDAVIYNEDGAILYLEAFEDKNRWYLSGTTKLDINTELKDIIYDLTKEDLTKVYLVSNMPGFWLNKGDSTYVYDFYLDKPKFVPVEEYIYKTITKETLNYIVDKL